MATKKFLGTLANLGWKPGVHARPKGETGYSPWLIVTPTETWGADTKPEAQALWKSLNESLQNFQTFITETLLYHGTSSTNADSIRRGGFQIGMTYRSDPGDFGRGVYLTGSLARAKAYGTVVRVQADLKNPLVFKNDHDAYAWRDKVCEVTGDTIQGTQEQRLAAAISFANYVKQRGHDGIIIHDPGTPYREVVVYDLTRIKVL